MVTFIEELVSDFNSLEAQVRSIFESLGNRDIPNRAAELHREFFSELAYLHNEIEQESPNIEKTKSRIKNLAIYMSNIGRILEESNIDEQTKQKANVAAIKADEILKKIDNEPTRLDIKNTKESQTISLSSEKINELNELLGRIRGEFSAQKEQNSSSLQKMQSKLDVIEQKSSQLEETVNAESSKAKELYEHSFEFLESKKSEAAELIESLTRDVFSGNYDERAHKEEQTADRLRNRSLVAMIIAATIIIATVIEASFNTHDVANAILRVGLIFAVSLPAAYLARESTRHREKHNFYLEKSLDLKAISPFISSLEKQDQDRIKSELADRLFANRYEQKKAENEIPLSAIEALSKVIDQVSNQKQK